MLTPPSPSNEAGRLAALRALKILDTPSEQRFDRITAFAKLLFEVPIALVSLIDHDRQWFKSRAGLEATETPRAVSFCGHAILADDLFVIEDATVDERFRDNPLVTGAPFVRFYAGMPLNAAGFRLGTLCIIDHKARQFSRRDRDLLRMLAGWVERELTILSELQTMSIRLESQTRLEAVLNGIADGVITTDAEGVVQSVNPAAAKIFAYRQDEFIGKRLHELVPPRDRAANIAYLQKLNDLPEPLVRAGLETIGQRGDGREFPLELSFSRLNLGDRRVYSAIVRDSSERKRHELERERQRQSAMELADAQAKYAAIVASSDDAIMSKTLDGIITSWNPAAESLFGYSAQEAIGRPMAMLVPLDRADEEPQILARIGRGERIEHFETVRVRKDRRPLEVSVSISPILNDSGNIVGASKIVRDISERKRLETMKGEFISTVSHELRTPLTSIRGALDLIIDGFAGEIPEDAREMIGIAHNNSERLVRLINDLLDMEKFNAGQMEFVLQPVALGSLLERAVGDNVGYAREHDVRFEIAGDVPKLSINVDHDRMLQVLTNLLSNAAKFSPPQAVVSVSARVQNGRVRISVADSGPGIPVEFHERIFGKFAQADSSDSRQKGGTGLGLSIAKAIVERHDGTIGFDTTTNKGTTFYFDLPVWSEMTSLPSTSSASECPEGARVLVCENDKDIARLLSMMLRQGGYQPDVAYNAGQAKEKLSRTKYVAMTLDLGLPDQDGISLIRELRDQASTHDLPIVVVSAKAQQGQAELNGDAIGIVDWLQKPIDAERFSKSLRAAVRISANARPRILHVEDDGDILAIVARIVGDGAMLVPARTVQQAIHLLTQERFDLVILDLGLPDGSGEAILSYVRRGLGKGTPVMIFSAEDLTGRTVTNVQRALVKSRTTNEELLQTINSFITRGGGKNRRASD